MLQLTPEYVWERLYPFLALSAISVALFYVFCKDGQKHFNGIDPKDDTTFYQKIGNRVYYTIMIVTTVGLGDITPKTLRARVITSGLLLAQVLQVMRVVRGA
jgi:hypothetical protein